MLKSSNGKSYSIGAVHILDGFDAKARGSVGLHDASAPTLDRHATLGSLRSVRVDPKMRLRAQPHGEPQNARQTRRVGRHLEGRCRASALLSMR